MSELSNDSPIGRLLEELSWEGNARKYRQGGRGLENVLVTEVFQLLDLLPRSDFLGQVFRSAHGDPQTLDALAAEVEQARVDVLPGGPDLYSGGPNIQPDVVIQAPGVTAMVEAKRIRANSFQPEQLAREFLVLHRDHPPGVRVLFLLLAEPPPIKVRGSGRLEIREAILRHLEPALRKADDPPDLDELVADLDRAVAWLTWSELDDALRVGAGAMHGLAPGVAASVARGVAAARRAIAWHT